MAYGEKETDGNGALAILHQFAGDIVDGGDVIGIDRMAQAEPIGQQRCAEQHGMIMERYQRPGPGADIQRGQKRVDTDDLAAHRRGAIIEDMLQKRNHGQPHSSSVATANKDSPAKDHPTRTPRPMRSR